MNDFTLIICIIILCVATLIGLNVEDDQPPVSKLTNIQFIETCIDGKQYNIMYNKVLAEHVSMVQVFGENGPINCTRGDSNE